MRWRQRTRRRAASASGNEGVVFCGYQGRLGHVRSVPWKETYQVQTAEYAQNERTAARSGPLPTRVCGSSAPRNCLPLRKVSSID